MDYAIFIGFLTTPHPFRKCIKDVHPISSAL